MRQILIVIFIFLAGSCRTPDLINVKLKKAKKNDGLLGSTQVSMIEIETEAYRTYAEINGLDTFMVYSYSHSPEEYFYSQYCKGQIDSELFENLMKRNDIDTSKLSLNHYDAESMVLIGRKHNGDCLIVADVNNNNDFTDDRSYILKDWFSVNQKLPIDKLPHVTVNNLISSYNNNRVSFSSSFYIKPSKGDSLMLWNTKPINSLNVSLVFSEYLLGKFRVRGRKYRIAVRNLLPKYIFDKRNTIIEVARKKKSFVFHRTHDISKLSHLSDMVNLKRNAVEFSGIGIAGAEIYLKIHPKINNADVIDDFAFEDFEKKDTFRFQTLLNKYDYIIADFWGSWCKPCISSFPELKELNTKLSNKRIGFIGFIYDDPLNANKIDSLLHVYNIDWSQMLLPNRNENTLIKQRNVLSYPTYFLINKKGRIIYRDIGIDGLGRVQEFMIKHKII